ncbi:MAG: hypothetical protein R3C45_06150 [Phycisphaerales bacterium]
MIFPLAMLDWPAWVQHPALVWLVTGLYLGLMALIGVYGLHRYRLVFLYGRHRRIRPRPGVRYDQLPLVTVQLPMFNEGAVVHRIIDAACAIDYPKDKLQVQVVDDSTDGSAELARRRRVLGRAAASISSTCTAPTARASRPGRWRRRPQPRPAN